MLLNDFYSYSISLKSYIPKHLCLLSGDIYLIGDSLYLYIHLG
jgi:hypothetical protein